MEPSNCKCSKEGRNLVVCIDGTSNQFGEKNTNVVELYSKIVKSEDSGQKPTQLTYYNSGIGTYAKPSWISVKYLMQVFDNCVDLAIAWNFEKIIIGAYRWLSDNYQENDRIFLFGFSRGAYQVRALAGMIQRVGLIHMGNEEQIPFAYELYATHKKTLADRFKTTFSRENVQVHFVGVWDTVSSVGIFRGKSLPLTDSADHVCFFRHALALDERRVKFLPEYVHGGVCERSTVPEHSKAQIQETGLNPSPHIKEVWFPGTHSDIGGGNQLNRDLDLGRTPFLWMSFEAVSCGLRLRPTQVEWRWDHLQDMKESLTGVWHIFEWVPFKRLSYQDESSTVYRSHNGRGRKIKPGQKVHSSIAFCDESYHPKAISSQQRCLCELVGKGSLLNREWVNGWEDLIEMDIFDLSLMPTVIERLKLERGSETSIWVYRLKAMMATDEGLAALRGRPNITDDLVWIFTRADQRPEVQECVIAILEMSSKGSASVLLSLEHCRWLLCIARENINHRNFAVRFLVHSLSKERSCEEIVDENLLSTLDKMTRDKQYNWVVDGACAMFTTILSQPTLSQKAFATNTLAIVRKRITAEDPKSQAVAKRLLGAILRGAENRQRLFDNGVLHSLLTKINNWDDTERLLFPLFLVNLYEYLPNDDKIFAQFTSELCDEMNDPQVGNSRRNILLVLRDTIHSEGLRERIWNSKIVKALRSAFNQGGSSERLLVLELYRKGIIYESLQDALFDTDTVRDLGHALDDDNEDIRSNAADFFIAAMALGRIRDKIFDTETVATLGHRVNDERSNIAISVAKIFTAAIAHDDMRDRIFDSGIVAEFRCALRHKDSNVRSSAVEIFTAAMGQDSPWDKIFVTGTVAALGHALSDRDINIRTSVVKFFTAAIAQEGLWGKIFHSGIIAALVHALDDKGLDIEASMTKGFVVASDPGGNIEQKHLEYFSPNPKWVTQSVNQIQNYPTHFIPERGTQSVQTRFPTHFTPKRGAQSVQTRFPTPFTPKRGAQSVQTRFPTHFTPKRETQSVQTRIPTHFSPKWGTQSAIQTEIFADDFRAKKFETGTVTRSVRVIGDRVSVLESEMVKFFIAAIAQEGIRDMIFDTETIVVLLGCALIDKAFVVRTEAMKFFIAAIAQEGVRDKIFDTKTVAALRFALVDEDSVVEAVKFFIAAIAQEGFRDKIFDIETIDVLVGALLDKASLVRAEVVKFFIAAIAQEGFRSKIIDNNIIAILARAIDNKAFVVRTEAVKFFTAAIAQEGFRYKILDTQTIAVLRYAVNDKAFVVRTEAVKFFIAAIAQERFRDKIFNTQIVAALRRALVDEDSIVQAVKFFIAAIAQEGFWDKIFDTETIAVLGCALVDKAFVVRTEAVKFFIAAISQEGFRGKIFDTESIAALGCALVDKASVLRTEAVKFFIAAIAQEGFRDKIFDIKTVATLRCALADEDSIVDVVRFFIAAIAQENFRDMIFDTKTIAALRCALNDEASVIRTEAIKFFIAAISQEGFQDKIFDTETVAALGCALVDKSSVVRTEAVKFFIAAISQEGIRDRIFDTKTILALNRSQDHDDEDTDIHQQSSFLIDATVAYFELLWAVLYALK